MEGAVNVGWESEVQTQLFAAEPACVGKERMGMVAGSSGRVEAFVVWFCLFVL